MPAEPDEVKINTLVEFCPGLDRVQAIRFLKVGQSLLRSDVAGC